MELFRCVFISLVALLSALKVQSKSLSYAGEHCKTGDNYLRIDCSSTKTSLNDSSQCDARADKSSKGNDANSTILNSVNGMKCIQFTHPNSGERYALKVEYRTGVGRVVFEKHRCDADNDPEEFRFKQERYRHGGRRFFVYKPVMNQSLCVTKDCFTQKLTLHKITQNETQDTPLFTGHNTEQFDRRCIFTIY